jgi:hypothetical protein
MLFKLEEYWESGEEGGTHRPEWKEGIRRSYSGKCVKNNGAY